MEDIITKFQSIYSNIKEEKGNLYLFMILKMDELVDKWSIVVSAPWLTNENQAEVFNYLLTKIRQTLNQEEGSSIARLGTFQPNEHLVRLVNQSIRVEGGSPIKLENTKINGYLIHEAYIFESVMPPGFIPSPSPSPSPSPEE